MRVAIITASTLGYKGEREDKSGPYIKKSRRKCRI